MIHLGDIKNMKGETTPIVDVVTGGSPCQDLSVAGKRAGMAGERSGLFMEQIRLIKEMREYDRTTNRREGIFIRPRFMVWENVPGAFSSNNGEDFRTVLEETAKIADPNAVIPRPSWRWSKAGCVLGDGWSIAWRVHDAQFWGVPQRRKRISLIADFGGLSAPEILFERKGMSGDITESGEPGKDAATDVRLGIEETGKAVSFQERAGKPGGGKGILIQNERTGALSTLNNQSVVYGISSYDSNSMKSGNPNSGIYEAETARILDLNGGSPACNQGGMAVVSMQSKQQSMMLSETTSGTLGANDYKEPQVVCVEGNGSRPSHKGDGWHEGDPMYTLNSTEHHAVAIENHPADSRVKVSEDGMVQTLSSRMGTGGGNVPMVMEQDVKTYQDVCGTVDCGIAKGTGNQLANQDMFGSNGAIVRRLTPLECERLQGFPDGWTDIGDWVDSNGKRHKASDSPRYKALGNSIALPFWFYLLRRISAQYERPATLGSLFDGIGGFPLCWERCNGKGTAIWASEIEEFPIAVTKYHFPE